jgi:peptidoglycan/xylan/chitin deacetylase (PgdA/CDA1 family)
MIVVYLIAGIITLLSVYIIFPWMIKLYIKYKTNKYLEQNNVSCLTFDDGPHPEYTPKILDLLDEAGIKATFFILGKQAEDNPEVVKDMLDRGHEIANHSYNHTHAWHSDPITTLVDLIKGEKVINKYIQNSRVKILRPPFGKVNLMSFLYSLFSKSKLVFWNLDSLDYKYESAHDLQRDFTPKIMPGQIILLHDDRYGDPENNCNAMVTVDALAGILNSIDREKIHFKTVSQALYPDK